MFYLYYIINRPLNELLRRNKMTKSIQKFKKVFPEYTDLSQEESIALLSSIKDKIRKKRRKYLATNYFDKFNNYEILLENQETILKQQGSISSTESETIIKDLMSPEIISNFYLPYIFNVGISETLDDLFFVKSSITDKDKVAHRFQNSLMGSGKLTSIVDLVNSYNYYVINEIFMVAVANNKHVLDMEGCNINGVPLKNFIKIEELLFNFFSSIYYNDGYKIKNIICSSDMFKIFESLPAYHKPFKMFNSNKYNLNYGGYLFDSDKKIYIYVFGGFKNKGILCLPEKAKIDTEDFFQGGDIYIDLDYIFSILIPLYPLQSYPNKIEERFASIAGSRILNHRKYFMLSLINI